MSPPSAMAEATKTVTTIARNVLLRRHEEKMAVFDKSLSAHYFPFAAKPRLVTRTAT